MSTFNLNQHRAFLLSSAKPRKFPETPSSFRQLPLTLGGSLVSTRAPLARCGPRDSPSSVTKEKQAEDDPDSGPMAMASLEIMAEESALSLDNGNWVILSSCLVGLLTGVGVVLFNNGVDEIRDLFLDDIPASWLRELPINSIRTRVVLVPALGGVIVGGLNWLRGELKGGGDEVKSALRPFLKAVAACVTLGTGNSLGPEGPSVEIGTSVAKGVGRIFDRRKAGQKKPSLVAAGSAAGISSGFNAAVAGCFFAVESVLWPSPSDSSASLTNTTSMVILSAVLASIVSEVGLGSEPAFKVPVYDFRSPGELPLYLLLGVICGVVSLTLSKCTSYLLSLVDNVHEATGIPKAVFPAFGGLATGLIALAYPEILYRGFDNVDLLLESRPFVRGLSADLLLQLVAIKILATSLCRASGLVGGYYAPSLFIGAATGTAYGKIISSVLLQSDTMLPFSLLEVASPQAYGLVGMAATLAGVCQVPLTAVLLLFELTQDYRIVLPLLGAVGFSSWITSGQSRRNVNQTIKNDVTAVTNPNGSVSTEVTKVSPSNWYVSRNTASDASNLCDVESSLCIEEEPALYLEEQLGQVLVSQALRGRYASVSMNSPLAEALNFMIEEKQSCAIVTDENNALVGLLTLDDIQEYSKSATLRKIRSKEVLVSELCCSSNGKKCGVPWTASPDMTLLSAQIGMNKHGIDHVPVIDTESGQPVGILDRDCIDLTCRALSARELLR
ncbi:hypothetical protein MLD38_026840 [Melastoma candidum]|uniref:Uncharacterized protein n=1 Tax=Melastoma candidum TaxID=119954 RepID=A0ACB9P3B0_9MYRT|nr:hypothetical protein MLD38_026840 [Melastoma candidum]